jgi:hypothetical protein
MICSGSRRSYGVLATAVEAAAVEVTASGPGQAGSVRGAAGIPGRSLAALC